MLVIVDQAEELITLSGESERDAFLGLLVRALDADPRLWVVMIIRSEFLTAFLGTEHARLFRDPVAVGKLGSAALVEVIEQPVWFGFRRRSRLRPASSTRSVRPRCFNWTGRRHRRDPAQTNHLRSSHRAILRTADRAGKYGLRGDRHP